MARKPKHGLHPLRIVEAMEAINEAAGELVTAANTTADMIERVSGDPTKLNLLATGLRDATRAFRAVIWPDGEG